MPTHCVPENNEKEPPRRPKRGGSSLFWMAGRTREPRNATEGVSYRKRLFPQAAEEIADIAVDFGGGGDDQALQGTVIDDRPRAADDVPKRWVDRSFDEIDEIRSPIWRDGRATESH